MSTKARAAIEDLYKVEGKAEIVNGEIVEMPPADDGPFQVLPTLQNNTRGNHGRVCEAGKKRDIMAPTGANSNENIGMPWHGARIPTSTTSGSLGQVSFSMIF